MAIAMIDSISLENWKTHHRSTLNFRKGTNVLVGVIGSGKSSVMDALCYGLFGTFPALQNRRISTNDLFMRKPFPADTAKVSVSFSVGHTKYRVERIVKKSGTNEGRLYVGDLLVAGPKPNQVTERIEQELQVSYELFSRAVYSEQNQVDYFLKLNPSERKKKLDELLDLQKYEVVRSNAGVLANHFRKSREGVSHSLAQLDAVLQQHDVNELRFRLMAHRQKVAEVAAQKESRGEVKRVLQSRLAACKEKVARAEEIERRIHSNRGVERSLSEQLDSFTRQHPEWIAHPVESLTREKSRVEGELKSLLLHRERRRGAELQFHRSAQRVELLTTRKQEWVSKTQGVSLPSIDAQLHLLREQKKELVEKQRGAQQSISDAQSLIRVFETQLREISSESTEAHALSGVCSSCKQEVSEAHRASMLAKAKEKMSELESKKGATQKERAALLVEEQGILTVLRGLDAALSEQEQLRVRCVDGQSILDELTRAESEKVVSEKELSSIPLVEESVLDALRSQAVYF